MSITGTDTNRARPAKADNRVATERASANQSDPSLEESWVPKPFQCRTARVTDALVVEVSGEIDMATAPELECAITASGESSPLVVVNLSEVSFFDSSALNSLIRSHQQLTARHIPLLLVVPTQHRVVRKVFEIANPTRLSFEVVATLDQALSREPILVSGERAEYASELRAVTDAR